MFNLCIKGDFKKKQLKIVQTKNILRYEGEGMAILVRRFFLVYLYILAQNQLGAKRVMWDIRSKNLQIVLIPEI